MKDIKQKIKNSLKSISKEVTKLSNNIYFQNALIILGMFFSFYVVDVGIRFISNDFTNFYKWTKLAPNLFTFSWISVFIAFLYLLKKKWRIIVFGLAIFVANILTLAQFIHLRIIGRFFGVSDIFMAGEAGDYALDSLKYIEPKIVAFILISLAFAVGTISLMYIFAKEFKRNKNYYIVTILSAFVLFFVFRFSAIDALGKKVDDSAWNAWRTPKNVYLDFNNQNKNMEVAGIYEKGFRNIYRYTHDLLFQDSKKLAEVVQNYFTSEDIVTKVDVNNDYTGIFEGKNVIYIMLETIDSWLVTEDVMPTLSNMMQTGWNFTNRYAPAFGGGATFNSEFASNTGLYSIPNGQSAYTFDGNSYPYSLANMFKTDGYVVNSVHANRANYYNRENIHQAFGYNTFYALRDLLTLTPERNYYKDSVLASDDEIYRMIVPDTEEKFMTFVITYTAHMPHDMTNDKCRDNQYNLFVEGNEALSCIRTLAHDTDEFLRILVERLEMEGKLDDTVLVMYSDHYAYTYPDQEYEAAIKGTDDVNLLQNVPFVIWTKDMEAKEINTIMDTADILPTVANLFNLSTYKESNYLSTDVFSINHENFVYFGDYSWYDGNIYYNGKDIKEEDKEYVEYMNKIVKRKITVSNNILLSDYYGKKN